MKPLHYLLILVAGLLLTTGISTYKLIQSNERAEALEAANTIYEKDFEALQEKNVKIIDSLQKVSEERAEVIEIRDRQINEILSNIEKLLNSTPNEEAIDTISDPDQLTELFSRHYPDHPRAGQRSH